MQDNRPPLLYLTHRIPYPPNKGDKVRSFNILRHLAERHQVYLGTFVDDPDDEQHVDDDDDRGSAGDHLDVHHAELLDDLDRSFPGWPDPDRPC